MTEEVAHFVTGGDVRHLREVTFGDIANCGSCAIETTSDRQRNPHGRNNRD